MISIVIRTETVSQELGIALRLPVCRVHYSMQSLQRAGRLLRQLSMQAEALALAAAPASRMTVSAAESSAIASPALVTRLGSAEAWCHGSGAAMPAYARSFGSSSLGINDDDRTFAFQSDAFGTADAGDVAASASQSSALDPHAIADACGAAELDALAAAGELAWAPTRGLQNLLGHVHLTYDLPWWASMRGHAWLLHAHQHRQTGPMLGATGHAARSLASRLRTTCLLTRTCCTGCAGWLQLR